MIGAIIGDIVGSRYEHGSEKPSSIAFFEKDCTYTDDTVLTLAVANAILEFNDQKKTRDSRVFYLNQLKLFGKRYPHAGYGQSFEQWLGAPDSKPYRSYGNGSAMRVSPVGYVFPSMKETLREAKKTAAITHNHPDGIRGAKAVAGAVHLAFRNRSKEEIKKFVEKDIGYSLDFDIGDLHRNYKFEIQCKYSVPQAIFAFLVSNDFEDAIRNAVYIGGDSDTVACIAGAIAGAFYKKIPDIIKTRLYAILDVEQKRIITAFNEKYGIEI